MHFFNNPFAMLVARVHGRDMPDRSFSHNLLAVRKFPGVIRLMARFHGVSRLRVCTGGRPGRPKCARRTSTLFSAVRDVPPYLKHGGHGTTASASGSVTVWGQSRHATHSFALHFPGEAQCGGRGCAEPRLILAPFRPDHLVSKLAALQYVAGVNTR